MTTPSEPTGQSFEQLVHNADAFLEQISLAVAGAIAGIDPASPGAAATRSALHRIAASLPEVSLVRLAKLAALNEALDGKVMEMVVATLDAIGIEPLVDMPDAGTVLTIFDPFIAEAEGRQLN